MRLHTWPALAFALVGLPLAPFAIIGAAPPAPATAPALPVEDWRAVDGEWIFVEDRTEGRAPEQQQPSMSARVKLRVEDNAIILVRSDGEIRMALDGSPTDISREGSASRYSGAWKDGAFKYQSEPLPVPPRDAAGEQAKPQGSMIRWTLRVTTEGLLAAVETDSGWNSVALYRHPQDIALPTPAKATIGDLAWLAGAWVGTRGTGGATAIEERWSPPLGGAMLAVSRSVSRDAMRAFEYLRIVERGGGLVYIAQPNGGLATEFVLTELAKDRAVFQNPRHDFPQRIVYALSPEGGLTASIGYTKGGRPRGFEYRREGNPVPDAQGHP